MNGRAVSCSAKFTSVTNSRRSPLSVPLTFTAAGPLPV
jgi:hypothetical protein